MKDLGLRLNPKSRLIDLEKEDDKNEHERNLKMVSQGIEIADAENTEPPPDKLKNIFTQLDNLKGSSVDSHFQRHRDLEAEILKEVYDDKCSEDARKT